MKRKIAIVSILSFIVLIPNVHAASFDFCVQSSAIWQLFGYILLALKIIIPVVIIVFGTIDFAKAIIDDKVVQDAAKKEIVRRYYNEQCNYKLGQSDMDTIQKEKLLMNELNISENDRTVVAKAHEKKKITHLPCAAIQVGRKYIAGKKTKLLSPVSSTIINAIKSITKIPDDVDLLSASILKPILSLKDKTLNFKESTLRLDEVLLALSICSVTNPIIKKALDNLYKLENCQMHATYMIPDEELIILNNLGVNVTCDPDAYIN